MNGAVAPILVVEDEARYARLISIILEREGYRVETAATGAEALVAAQARPFELILLDLGLPDRDGAELCRVIRAFSDTPLIVVTARTSLASRVSSLDVGADDYLTKPFAPEELLARMRAVLRRTRARPAPSAMPLVQLGDLSVDLVGGNVRVRGEEVSLTPKEYQLLVTLVHHSGRLLPADTILELVWGPAYVGEHYLVRLFVSRLRRKLGDFPHSPRYIETKPGIGYRFPPSASSPETPG